MNSPDPSRFPLIVGITGHRDPLDVESVKNQLRELFRELDRMTPQTPIVLLSPLAEGCDQLFAEVGLEVLGGRPAGVELVAVLPFRLEDYRCDFVGALAALDRFEALLSRAANSIELPPRSPNDLSAWTTPDGREVQRVGTPPDIDASELRALHYDRLGRFMAVHAHAMVALWNGWNAPVVEGKRTLAGGTSNVVAYCRDGGASGREGGTPLREEIPTILDNPRIPVFLVHTRRARDLAAGTSREDLSPELRTRFGLHLSSSLEARANAAARFGGRELGAHASADLASDRDATEPWRDFAEAVGHLETLNGFPRESIQRGGELLGSPAYQGLGMPLRVLRALAWPLLNVLAVTRGRGGSVKATRALDDFAEDTAALLFRPRKGAYVPESLASEVEARQDAGLSRLLEMYKRADALAGFDVAAYAVAANAALISLALALIFFQLFSSWSEWWYVALYLCGLFLWARLKRDLKRRERARAMSRGLAEFIRVQFAWRLAAVDRLVADGLGPRRTNLMGTMRYLLESMTLSCVLHPLRESPSIPTLEKCRLYWIGDQLGYIDGKSTARKRRRADRRDARKAYFRIAVLGIAAVALIVTLLQWVGVDLGENWLADNATSLANFSMGVSLVTMLMTELRGSIALDREDADSSQVSRPLYCAASRQIEEALAAGDCGLASRVASELGRAVLDEQAEWYLRHRDGAQVEIVG